MIWVRSCLSCRRPEGAGCPAWQRRCFTLAVPVCAGSDGLLRTLVRMTHANFERVVAGQAAVVQALQGMRAAQGAGAAQADARAAKLPPNWVAPWPAQTLLSHASALCAPEQRMLPVRLVSCASVRNTRMQAHPPTRKACDSTPPTHA